MREPGEHSSRSQVKSLWGLSSPPPRVITPNGSHESVRQSVLQSVCPSRSPNILKLSSYSLAALGVCLNLPNDPEGLYGILT